MERELVIVLDFGGQYNQLVARRVRECNVYCEIYSYKVDIETIKSKNPKGIILTGGPNSCYEEGAPTYSRELFEMGIPVLGLCYGAQLMSHVLGGKVERATVKEYGKTEVIIDKTESKIFEGVSPKTICWMSHFDYVSQIAPGFDFCAQLAQPQPHGGQNQIFLRRGVPGAGQQLGYRERKLLRQWLQKKNVRETQTTFPFTYSLR